MNRGRRLCGRRTGAAVHAQAAAVTGADTFRWITARTIGLTASRHGAAHALSAAVSFRAAGGSAGKGRRRGESRHEEGGNERILKKRHRFLLIESHKATRHPLPGAARRREKALADASASVQEKKGGPRGEAESTGGARGAAWRCRKGVVGASS